MRCYFPLNQHPTSGGIRYMQEDVEEMGWYGLRRWVKCNQLTNIYMLYAKFGSGQSSDYSAQSSDLSFVQQSSDRPHNPPIAPNEVRKVWMKDDPWITRVTQETSLKVDEEGKVQWRNRDQKSTMLGEAHRAELGKVHKEVLIESQSSPCLIITTPCFQISFRIGRFLLSTSRKVSRCGILQTLYTNQRTRAKYM